MNSKNNSSLINEIASLKKQITELENQKSFLANALLENEVDPTYSIELKPAEKNYFKIRKNDHGDYIFYYNEGFPPFIVCNDPSEIIGKRVQEVYNEKLLDPKIINQFDRAFAGEVVSYTVSNGASSNHTFLCPVSADNIVTEIIGVRVDISARNKYLKALEESEHNFRELIEASNFALYVSSVSDDVIMLMNQAARDLYGFGDLNPKSAIHISEYVVDKKVLNDIIVDLREEHRIDNYTLQVKDTKEEKKWILASVVRIKYQNQDAYLHSIIDITENVTYQEKLRFESEVNKELSELYKPITSLQNIEEISRLALAKVKQLTKSSLGFIALIDDESGDLYSPTINNWNKKRSPQMSFENLVKEVFSKDSQGQYLYNIGKAISSRKGFYMNEIIADELTAKMPAEHAKINQFISIPIIINDKLVGQISLANSSREYSDSDIILLERFAEYFGLALQQNFNVERIKRSEANLTALINNTQDQIWAIDSNYRLIAANSNFLENYNKTYNENLRINDNILSTGPNELSFWRALYSRAFSGETINEEQAYFDNGEKKYYDISLRPIFNGSNIIGVTAYSKDISLRKIEEEILKRNEEKYRFMTENISDIFWQTDINLTLTYVSPASELLFKFAPSELIGKSITHLMKPDFQTQMHSLLEQRFLTHNYSSALYETQILTGSGDYIWSEILVNPIVNNNTIVGFQGLVRNIEDRKHAQQKQERYTESLKQLNSAKDKFFSIIAHDLKNPIATLLNASDILAKPELDLSREETLEYAKDLNNSTKQLYNLLDNLLTWSRSQTNQIKFEPTKIDMSEIGTMNYYLLMMQAEAKNIKLITKIKSNIFGFADFNMINTVVRNLTSNAIKFTPEFGEIIIKATYSGNKVIVSVSDTGIGLSPEDIYKLFRIDISHTTIGSEGEKGTGLGLILCKEFVEKNSGEIWVESEIGKGSTFYFTIPKFE